MAKLFQKAGLVTAMALIVGLVPGLAAAAERTMAPYEDSIEFKVLRGNSEIGHHRVSFRRDGDALHAVIDIELEVGFGPVTLFEYAHRNEEVWQDGRLVRLDSQTNDNGDEHWTKVRRDGDDLIVTGSRVERYRTAGTTFPTSYWNPRTVEQDKMINTQDGRLMDLSIEPEGRERILVAGDKEGAARYSVTGDLDMTLWYGPGQPAGEWKKIVFQAKGERIEYVRVAPAGESDVRAARNQLQ